MSVQVDENGNPIAAAPAAPAAPGAAAPAPAVATPAPAASTGGSTPVDENGNPIPHDFFEQYIRPNLPGFLTSNIPVTDPQGNLQPVASHNSVDEARNFAIRAGLRAAPITAWPNAAIVGGQVAGDWANRKLGLTPADAPQQQPFNPIEAFIDKAGIGQDPNASFGAKTADSIAPWLVPSPQTAARVAEAAPNLISKVSALGGSTVAGAADWALSNATQDWLKNHGYGPMAQMLGAIAAPLTRGAAFRVAGQTAHAAGGADEGGDMFDLYRSEGQTPPASEVVSPPVQEFVKKAGDIPLLSTSMFGHLMGGPHGAALGAAISTGGKYLGSAINDPSVVRAFADRAVTSPLLQQYASRAALGANAQAPPTPLTQTIMQYLQPGQQ